MIKKKAQAALESSVAYIAGLTILGAVMGIWAWGNGNIPIRQVVYAVTRIEAGTSGRSVSSNGASTGFKPAAWPRYFAIPCP